MTVRSTVDVHELAQELVEAYVNKRILAPLSSRVPQFDLTAAYAVEAEIARTRAASGHRPSGRKIGYANKAVWRLLQLETLVWAHMYDDTVHRATLNAASLSIASMHSPRIEPEIVFRLKRPLDGRQTDAEAVLAAVEWLALGFEIIDCVFDGWTFQPADFVASKGLHAALVVGDPLAVTGDNAQTIADRLPRFRVRLMEGDRMVEEGSGRNSLRSPALCLGELAAAIARQPGAEPLAAGELVSSGTLTDPQPIAAGQTWTATVEGLDLPALTLRVHGGSPDAGTALHR